MRFSKKMSVLSQKNSFYSTCFKPLAIWMQILGIELEPFHSSQRKKTTSFYYCSKFFSFLMFAITVSTNICFISLTFQQEFLPQLDINDNSDGSASEFWNLIIDFGSYTVLAIGTHAALLSVPRHCEWKFLWNNLQQLATEYGQLFHDKSRKIVLTSLLFVITDGSVNIIQGVLTAIQNDGRPLLTKSLDFISYSTQIYGVGGLVLFATIGWMTSEGFVQLRHQVTMALNPPVSSSDLKKWRRHFLMLNEIVLHMGRCFGPLMLIWIVYIFINVIGNSFYLLNSVICGISDDDQPSSEIPFWICTVTRNLIFLFILASTPVTLRHQSLDIWKSLRRIKFDDPSLQCQLDRITMEVLQSPTEMTAMDLFSVNLTLFPTLVGTTLTYLIILSQFK